MIYVRINQRPASLNNSKSTQAVSILPTDFKSRKHSNIECKEFTR